MLACVPVLQGDLITPADLCFLKTICKSCTSKNPTNKKKARDYFFFFSTTFHGCEVRLRRSEGGRQSHNSGAKFSLNFCWGC